MPTPTPSTNDDAPETPAAGKGRATPTRAEREAARRRPLVANTKEAKAAARAEVEARRLRARRGLERGEEKYLQPRDKGPQRRWVRDYVDAGWHVSEWLLGAMLIVVAINLVPLSGMQQYAMFGLYGYMAITIIDMLLLGYRIKRKTAEKFGARVEKGLGRYAAMRAMQLRFMRLPKPQVARGQYPS